MEWGAPAYLWLAAAAIPLAALVAAGARQSRLELKSLYPSRGTVPLEGASRPPSPSLSRGGRWRGWGASAAARVAIFSVAVFLMIAALCRPQWGAVAETRQAKGIDIVIALDVSRSMGADDAVPTRLAAAKEAVADLVAGLSGDRIGLIAFAGSAFTICPLTSDYALFNSVLSDAGPGTIPLGGTSLAAALEEAARAFPPKEGGGRVLVVISDGEDHGADPAAAAARLRQEGIMVCPVAVGTLRGALIPEESGTFLKDRRGVVVKSRLEPASLQRIVAAGGGKVVELEKGGRQLAALYRTGQSSLEQKTSATTRQRLRERFQIPLALAVGLLAAEPLLGFRRRR